jgi:hypothetical protein
MRSMSRDAAGRRLGVRVAALVLVLACPVLADVRLSQRDADSLSRKLMAMRQHADAPPGGSWLTPVTENEVNAFLQMNMRSRLPVGLRDPHLTLAADGRVAGSALVDLDAVRRAVPPDRTWLDPRRLLSGQLPVEARGTLKAEHGRAQFWLDGAEVSGVPLPKVLLQEIVTYYSRSPEFPSGVDLDAPFDLPARIREIHVNEHQAVVVQR